MRAGGVEGPQSRHRLGRRDRVDAEIGGSFLGLRNAQPLTPTSPEFRVEGGVIRVGTGWAGGTDGGAEIGGSPWACSVGTPADEQRPGFPHFRKRSINPALPAQRFR